ncbi:hypothetical protein MGG_04610 [Pyricularia oryzae 70-15]|uniref:Alcohol acetyltransferase n=3 Tax=Pyricularia oryzae TaxID=318829 RepID=G4MRQ7_PYRO7|nr:uncharacterized protein MGG_04610 [Pyricularia oryzae 70-15]EHA58272.1 hypothetical protein MGG_04610 [Pyricularia oryzae 70-15]ELQ39361.1 hypothetical protein OOU_Y34scaffold00500g8 [Pyricularia oryzae Y34]KAI7929270.1 hypothetical protein M0657_002245 [Pyricularia oryzae]
MAPENFLRPLGKYETMSSSRHSLGFYRRVINTCRYEQAPSDNDTQPLQQVIEAALARVVLELPGLRIAIADESSPNPSFVAVPSIDIRSHHLEFVSLDHRDHDQECSDDPALMQFLQGEHSKLWPNVSSQPPWKLTVVQRAGSPLVDLVYAAHHGITDGGGTARFHAFLLRSLSASSQLPFPQELSAESGVLDCSVHRPNLGPEMSQLVKLDVSWLYLAKEVVKDMAPAWLSGTVAPWAGAPPNPEPYQTHLRLVTVAPELATMLKSACRARQTTLTPLLHALVLVSLCRVLPDEDKTIPGLSFAADTPISLRPYMTRPLPTGFNEPSLSVPMVTTHRHLFSGPTVSRALASSNDDDELVWSVAAQIKSTLAQRQSTLPRDDVAGLLPYSGDWRTRWLAAAARPRSGTWEISNLGAVPEPIGSTAGMDFAQQPSWRITRTIFSQGTDVCGDAFGLSVAGSRDSGTICISINWQQGILDVEMMDRFTREFRALLERTGRAAARDA